VRRRLLLASAWLLLGAAAFAASPAFQTIVVKPGETLWGIAQRYLKNPKRWNELLSYNELPTRDPTVALPGMTLRVPVEMVKEQMRAADLVEIRKEVLARRRETADWNPARLHMELYPDDGVRTTAAAEAKVRFFGGEVLSLGENSMVILSPPRRESDLKLLKGEVRGRKARVLTASALIVPKSDDASFSARVKDDLTTLVQVYAGKAAVQAQGQTVELKAGFASEVKLDKPPSDPIPLPELPAFSASSGGAANAGPAMVLEGTNLSLKLPQQAAEKGEANGGVVKAVALGAPIQAFHIQVATDRDFSHIAIDRKESALQTLNLENLPLPPGVVWWRVAMIDLLGFEGPWSAPRSYERRK
jgi:hypothetical protein